MVHWTYVFKTQVIFRWFRTEKHLTWEGISPALDISHVLTTHTPSQQQQPQESRFFLQPKVQGSGLNSVLLCIWTTSWSCLILEFSSFLELSSAFFPLYFNTLANSDSFHTTPAFFAVVFILACYHFDFGQSRFFLPRVRFISFLWLESGPNHKIAGPGACLDFKIAKNWVGLFLNDFFWHWNPP